MGVVSQAALRSGGNATGIIPYALAKSGGEKSAGGIQTNGRRNSVAELRGVKNYHDDLPDEAKARVCDYFVCGTMYVKLTNILSCPTSWKAYVVGSILDL